MLAMLEPYPPIPFEAAALPNPLEQLTNRGPNVTITSSAYNETAPGSSHCTGCQLGGLGPGLCMRYGKLSLSDVSSINFLYILLLLWCALIGSICPSTFTLMIAEPEQGFNHPNMKSGDNRGFFRSEFKPPYPEFNMNDSFSTFVINAIPFLY